MRTNEKKMENLIIRQVSITEIKVSGQEQYTNGDFIPMFIDVLQGIAKDDKMKPTTLRVLLYILTIVDKNNDVAIYVDKEGKKDEAQVQDTESKKVSRKVSRTRSLVRRASMRGEGSLRSRKASILITNQE